MLNIEKFCRLYSAGVDVKMRIKFSSERPSEKGLWDLSLGEVNIYLPAIESREDLHITLIHEFIHAQKDYSNLKQGRDSSVEALAQKIYKINPNLAFEIIELYNLKVPKRLR